MEASGKKEKKGLMDMDNSVVIGWHIKGLNDNGTLQLKKQIIQGQKSHLSLWHMASYVVSPQPCL